MRGRGLVTLPESANLYRGEHDLFLQWNRALPYVVLLGLPMPIRSAWHVE